eukprot:jgi/Psemu1/324465/estExt_fgenesh1_pg.C_1470005
MVGPPESNMGIELMDDDQPFDVVKANSSLDESYTRRSASYIIEEEGDLPALSMSTSHASAASNGNNSQSSTVDVHQATTGMNKKTPLNDSVLSQATTLTRNGDDRSPPREQFSRGQSYRNEMPMDERQEYEDEMKALALCDYGEGSQAMPEFCDSALRAMNELCAGGGGGGGAGSSTAESPSRRVDKGEGSATNKTRNLKLGKKHSVHNGASGVEEQTAIEVEYVEPLYRGRGGEDDGANYSSPKRKNALLKAMTRRAKDDFKTKGKKKKAGAMTTDEIAELELQQDAEASEGEDRDNVYATFSSIEKRKFLQLINGGVSPTDATTKILRERRNRDERDDDDDPSLAESSIPSEYPGVHEDDDENGDERDRRPVPAAKSGKKGINKLAFWKRKNKGTSAASVVSPVPPKPSPENTADRVDSTPDNGNKDSDDEDDDGGSQSTSSCEHVGDEIKKFLREDREESRANKVAQSKTKEIAVRGANEIIGDLDRSMSQSRHYDVGNNASEFATSKNGDEEDDNQFEKSGIKYYDAVRKDRSAEYDYYNEDEMARESSASTSSKRHRKLNIIPKSIKGSISKLKNNYTNPRATPLPEEAEDDYDENDFEDGGHPDVYQDEVEENEEYKSSAAEEQNNGILQTMSEESLLDDADNDNLMEERKAEERRAEEQRAEEQRAEEQRAEEQRAEEQRAEEQRAEEQRAEEQRAEERRAEEQRAEEQRAEEQGNDMGDAIEDAMTAKLLGLAAPAAEADKAGINKDETAVEQQDSLDMDAYLSETMSQMGGAATGRSFDAVSVVSGKSHKTSHTTGTNYTSLSTRSRRRGQAKVRLEKEKEALNISGMTNKSHGWHESIEAAAARAGKVWDPDQGWKDYVDPNLIEHPSDDFFVGAMVIPSARRQQQQQTDVLSVNTGAVGTVVSPSEARSPSRSAGKSPRSPARSTPGRQRKPHKVVMSPKDGRPRGWAETMKAATSKLNMEGKQWDPVKGWVGLSEEEARKVGMSDSEQRRDALDDVAITADSDMQDFGTLDHDIVNDAANYTEGEEETTVDGDQSSTTKSTSKNSGRYIQIAETGSIQSHYRRSRADPNSRRMVNVKRENLNEGEADLFQESAERQKGIGPVDLDSLYEEEPYATAFHTKQEEEEVVSGPNANEVYQKIYESQSNGSFDAATDFSWDADDVANETIDSFGRKPVPRLKISIRDAASVSSRPNSAKSSSRAQSEASFESGSSSIPKLAAPKRDTSPIRPLKKTSVTPTSSTPSHLTQDNESPFKEHSPFKNIVSPNNDLRPENKDNSIKSTQHEGNETEDDDDHAAVVDRAVDSMKPNASSKPSTKAPPKLAELHKLWEARTTSWDKDDVKRNELSKNNSPGGGLTNAHNPEWNSFLKKKVQAESAAASAAITRDAEEDEERDTIFDFEVDSPANLQKSSREKARRRGSGSGKLGEPEDESAFDEISELSPIRHHNDDTESDFGQNSEASTAVLQGTTFLQRLQACAAPVMKGGTNCASEGPISAHLAFLRNNPGVGGSPEKNTPPSNLVSRGKSGILQASAGMCGRPGVIVEDDEDESTVEESVPSRSPMQSPPPPNMNKNAQDINSRSRSNPRSRQSANKDDLSSVISDGFGAKSAYLEAIAMKAAVAGGSKKKKRRSTGSEASAATATSRRSSTGSILSASANPKHSEKFQQFLDRRASKDERPMPQRPPQSPGRSEVSNRAEKYASEKMNEMMDNMAGQNRGRVQEEYERTGAFPTLPSNAAPMPPDAARQAAEDLAAARVEAMMQRLSAQNLEHNEAEI